MGSVVLVLAVEAFHIAAERGSAVVAFDAVGSSYQGLALAWDPMGTEPR